MVSDRQLYKLPWVGALHTFYSSSLPRILLWNELWKNIEGFYFKIKTPQISLQWSKAILTHAVKSGNSDSNYTLNLLQGLQWKLIWKTSLKVPSSQTLKLV